MKKLIMAAAMSTTALTALAGAVSAQESYAVTKYEYVHGETADTHGLSFTLSGSYDSGLSYEMMLMAGQADGVGMTGADLELGYRFSGIAGPVALYEFNDVAGVRSDALLIGVEGGTQMGAAEVFGKLLLDTDDQDVYRLAIGADYDLTEDFAVNGELTHFQNVGAADVNLLEVGARYRVMGDLHADVGAHYGRAEGGAEQTGLHLGLGFDF